MIHNMVGGGQGEGPIENSTIVVTYPEGATCTVTGNGQTYTALDTSGAAAFIVEPGTWTVTATPTGGGTPASQSVTVTAGGWVEVELSFVDYFFQNGVFSIIGGVSRVNAGTVTVSANISLTGTGNNYAGILNNNPVNLSKYNNITVKIASGISWEGLAHASYPYYVPYVALLPSKPTAFNAGGLPNDATILAKTEMVGTGDERLILTANQEVTVPCSTLTGNGYILICIAGASAFSDTNIVVSEMRGE